MNIPVLSIFLVTLSLIACTNNSDPQQNAAAPASAESAAANDKGVGPVKSVVLEAELKEELAKKGHDLFAAKCSACHKTDERYVGPALKGVTERRKPEWIMNMILNPQEMLDKDATAKELLGEFLVPMTFQNVNQEEARALLEYFRQLDKK